MLAKKDIFCDNRGLNYSINNQEEIKQIFFSKSRKNVIRGIHKSSYKKRITVLSGSITDFIIDFSGNKPTYKKYELSPEKSNQIEIPANSGHLFISNSDETIILYELFGYFDDKLDININYLDQEINLDIPKNVNYIISDKDKNSDFYRKAEYIVMGSKGYLGSEMCKYLNKQNINYIELNCRLHKYEELNFYLEKYKPKYVICAAGISGKPTIKWCDDNKDETFKTNVTDTLELCKICKNLNIHLTLFGTGLVYSYDVNNPDKLFSETDEINNYNNFYTKCRILLEKQIEILYDNVLNLRVIYPIGLTNNPKCFLKKILTRTDNIHKIKVNITFLPQLFPLIPELLENKNTGNFNFVSSDSIYLHEIIDIYNKNTKSEIKYNLIDHKPSCGLLNNDKLKSVTTKNIEDIKKVLNIYLTQQL
jgi:3,5-epimerase/4-reductase